MVSRRKKREGDQAVGFRQGEAVTFQRPAQAHLQRLLQMGQVVPVTGRRLELFEELRLGWFSRVILNHGASLLLEGQLDEVWHHHMLAQVDPQQPQLEQAHVALHQAGVAVRYIQDFGVRWYLEAEGPAMPIEAVAKHWALEVQFTGRKWALFPAGISKAAAVQHVLSQGRPPLVLGLGDMPRDRSFLHLCDYAIVPTDSFLWDSLGGPDAE